MPRIAWNNPFGEQDPERAQLIQAYMVLHSQQTSIRRRLSSASSVSSASSNSSLSPSPRPSSPELSPARIAVYHNSPTGTSPPEVTSASLSSLSYESFSPRSPRPSSGDRRTSVPTVPCIPEDPDEEDEGKLFDVNGKIKTTLTDLLNCESIKHDARMRTWVQTRLMDAQQALNSERRRTVSVAHAQAVARTTDTPRKLSL